MPARYGFLPQITGAHEGRPYEQNGGNVDSSGRMAPYALTLAMQRRPRNIRFSFSHQQDGDVKPALSNIIESVFDPNRDPITCGELVDELDRHGMAVILILFSVPAALPVPAAGYSTLLSVPLLIIGLRLLAGCDNLWLPARLRRRPFNTARFNRRLVDAMLRLVQMVERFSTPRLIGLVRAPAMRVIIGLVICALACSMLLPIPGTNTAPAFGIFLIGFSLLEDDGVLLLAGVLCSLLALFISLLIVFFGYKSYLWLREAVRGFF